MNSPTLVPGLPCREGRSIHALAVVGTSGRSGDGVRVDRALYARMAEALRALLVQAGPVDRLVAGGDPVAGHLAVGFFLRGIVPGLSLHLPTNFSVLASCFVEPYAKSTGSIANYWHREFSRRCGGNSLDGVGRAIMKSGCVRRTYLGFEERSAGISAEADAVVALTFGDGVDAIGSETRLVLEQCLRRGIPSWHVSLPSCQIFAPARVADGQLGKNTSANLGHGGSFTQPCSIAA